MKYLLNATLEDDTLRLDERLPLPSGTRVRIIVEPDDGDGKNAEPYEWIRTALEANLEGPSDASVRVNDPSYSLSDDEGNK